MELFFDLYGRRGSGKGTTLEVLKAIAGGKDSIGSLRNDYRNTTLFGLIGKKVAINNDAHGHISDPALFDSIVSLPIYPLLSDKEVDYIIDCIKELFVKYSI